VAGGVGQCLSQHRQQRIGHVAAQHTVERTVQGQLRAEPERDVRVAIRAGTRRPMDKSASSLAFKRFERKTVQAFASAGVAGIASSSGVGDPLLASMAAPLFGMSDAFVGVLTLSGVIGHFDVDDERIRSQLFDDALAASALLGAAP